MRYQATKAFATLASLGLLGCSFVLVSGPPSAPAERTEEAASECTDVVVPPAVDTLIATMWGGLFIFAAAAADSDEQREGPLGAAWTPATLAAVGAVNLAVFGSSATYGFIQTSRCRALRREVRERRPDRPVWSPALAAESRNPVPVPAPLASSQSALPPPAVPPSPPTAPASDSSAPAPNPTPSGSTAPSVVSFPDP